MTAPIRPFTLRASINNTGAGADIPAGLRVVAVDDTAGRASVVVTDDTDESGTVVLEFSSADAAALFEGATDIWTHTATLSVGVYNGDVFFGSTAVSLGLADVMRGELPVTIDVDLTATATTTFSVSGRVVDRRGQGVPQTRVALMQVEADTSTTLVFDDTASDGVFLVSYPGHDAATPRDPAVALQLVATNTQSSEEIGRTPIIFEPDPEHRVDIVIESDFVGRSEFERIEAALAEFAPTVDVAQVGEAQLELLARRADLFPSYLAAFVQAHRLADRQSVPATDFYALLRAGFGPELSAIVMRSQSDLRAALLRGYEHALIPWPSSGDPQTAVTTSMVAVEDMVVDATMTAALAGQEGTREWLDVSGLPEATLRTWMRRFIQHEGSLDEFWTAVESEGLLAQAELDTLRFTTEVAATTQRYLPLMTAVAAQRSSGAITTVADLAAWDVADWEGVLAPIGAPDGTPGDTAAEQISHYAAALNRTIGERYPTRRLTERLIRDDPGFQEGVATFLGDNPDFDIDSTVVVAYLEQNPGAIAGGHDPALVEANLKATQRLHRIAPPGERAEVTIMLRELGYTSASDIVRLGKGGFADTVGNLLDNLHSEHDGPALLGKLYGAALHKHGMSMAVLAQYGASFSGPTLTPMPPAGFEAQGQAGAATIEELFGSLDYCACEHCRSVLSPAAYLVDLLALIESIGPAAANALDVLRQRRADLPALELSCTNTNTVLPHIDLVNELLEQIVVDSAAPLVARQTTREAEVLRLAPEHRDDAAYDEPAAAVFPWSLPVHVPGEELRAYAEALGAPRVDVMRALEAAGVQPADIVAEHFGLSRQAAHTLSGNDLFSAGGGITDTPTDAAWGRAGVANFHDVLAADLAQLLSRSGLSFDELVSMLSLHFVNPGGTVTLQYANDEPSCDLADISLAGASVGFFDAVHRFVRLRQATGHDDAFLDELIETVGGGSLDSDVLLSLMGAQRIQQRLSLSPAQALSLWHPLSTLSTGDEPTAFERVFASPLLSREPDPAFSLAGGELANVVALDASHYPTIRAALGLGLDDASLRRLVDEVLPDSGAFSPPAPALNVANLSALHRHARLAQALGLSVGELLSVLALSSARPFVDADGTLAFADDVARILASTFSVAALDYLCRHQFAAGDGVAMSDEAAADVVRAIAVRVAEAEAEIEADADTPEATARQHLSAVFGDPAVVEDWMRVLSGDSLGVGSADSIRLQQSLNAIGADSTWVEGELVPEFDVRYGVVDRQLSAYRIALAHRAVVAEVLAEQLGTAAGLATDLDVGSAEFLASTALQVEATLVGPLDGAGNPTAEQIEAVLRMHKAAMVVTGFGIPVDELPWYFATPAGSQTMDLTALPTTATIDGTASFAGWSRVERSLALRETYRGDDNIFAQITAAADMTEVAQLLADRSDHDVVDFAWALGPALLDLSDPGDLAEVEHLAQVHNVLHWVAETGMDAAALAAWAAPVDPAVTADARRALRARHDETRWPDVIRPIADRLREVRRDALLDTLIGRGDFSDATAVYEHLLIDPQMSACMLTSRVKAAIGSAQLLVQRGLMHLEADDFTVPPAVAERWEWQKNYRVWEANRKVFFYPQNWVEPELRDDKSPFFEELEQQIEQGDLTDDNVEQALKDYLYKLHEVSHLDVIAIDEERPTPEQQIVHVIGRTRGQPRKHFYRRRHDDQYWTPWEAIPLDIPSSHVLAVSHNRRLFLFWAEFFEGAESGDDATPKVRVALAWSEYRDGRWSPKLLSEQSSKSFVASIDKASMFLMGYSTSGPLYVEMVHDHYGEADNHSFATFVYDDCLDRLVERALPLGFEYQAVQLGITNGRMTSGQQQAAVPDDAGGTLFDRYRPQLDGYGWLPIIRNPGGHRVTFTRQEPVHLGTRPAVFDSPEHALYVVLENDVGRSDPSVPPGPGGLADPGGVADPGEPIPPVPIVNRPSIDNLTFAEPWEGAVPGTRLSKFNAGDLGEGVPTTTVLAHAATTIGAPTDAWVPGGAPAAAMDEDLAAYRLDPFHHPYTCALRSDLNRHGIDGVLGNKGQHTRQLTEFVPFSPPGGGAPENQLMAVAEPYPVDNFDFSFGGAYSVYNWELFYHVPLLIAQRLRNEQRFEQAQRWLHYVFNPLAGVEPGVSGPERFWNVKPLFLETAGGAPDIIESIFSDDGLTGEASVVAGFVASVAQWLKNPFSPHAIARARPGTYRWVAVRKYLDNLLDWADSLLRRDTAESIGEATQLYVLAGSILGRRPERLPEITTPVRTYDDLAAAAWFGGLTELEGFLPAPAGAIDWEAAAPPEPPPAPVWWYFCVPPNEQLLGYWDTVADRLFKIRHCQNIDGVTRQLALFEPPIDPALLVRARAAGVDLSSVLDALHAPMPNHRYRVLAARALEVCGDVRALGGALLSALEKKDAERLAQLRAQHEVSLLRTVRDTRLSQIREAEAAIEALDAQRSTIEQRIEYYGSRKKRSGREKKHLKKLRLSSGLMIASQSLSLVASIVQEIPTLQLGPSGGKKIGGEVYAAIPRLIGDGLSMGSAIVRNQAERQQINAGYDRRWDDWQFSAAQAKRELAALEKQRIAAEIRLEIARKELGNHDRQVEQSAAFEVALRDKYTNDQLYTWLSGQVSGLYFQSYKLAHELARKAERAMQWELSTSDSFVEYGYWDSLHKGLMAGERLVLDLRRMEAAYLDRSVREHELTKRISLRQLDPEALHDLRETGSCEFVLPEALFDLDHPGHYMRRLRAVSLSVPAVVGPHTSLGATLTLLEDQVRVSNDATAPYAPDAATIIDDARFRLGFGRNQSIATSRGQQDSGLFVLDFRDERFLPFEGAGAVSRWRLQLPEQVRQFDYDSISDVEVQVQYSARSGGDAFRAAVESHLSTQFDEELAAASSQGLTLVLSARSAFGPAWERFLDPAQGQSGDPIELPIVLERFGFAMASRAPQVQSVRTVLLAREDASGVFSNPGAATITPPAVDAIDFTVGAVGANVEGVVPATNPPLSIAVTDEPWQLSFGSLSIDEPEQVRDLLVFVRFTLGGS